MPRTLATASVVIAGGSLGTLARWGVLEVGERLGWSVWVFLLVVNVTGAFLLGWFATHAQARRAHPLVVAFTAAGVLGAFTTFSGFTVEAVEGVRAGNGVASVLFVFGSLLVGVLAAMAGRVVAARP
jgi:CrcB protein